MLIVGDEIMRAWGLGGAGCAGWDETVTRLARDRDAVGDGLVRVVVARGTLDKGGMVHARVGTARATVGDNLRRLVARWDVCYKATAGCAP